MHRAKIIFGKLYKKGIGIVRFFDSYKYQILYRKWMQYVGIKLPGGTPGYIAPDVKFDSTDYSLITLENHVVISTGVLLLVHDYSGNHLYDKLHKVEKEIYISYGAFVGARALILPGTIIGRNSIIGAGSVVKGEIPDNVVAAGNPCRILCTIEEYKKKQINREGLGR